MGTIKIGSSSNRKGVTINPSVVLFNGNNVKKIMSGLTEIWSDIKALVPKMTSNTTPYGEASASSKYDTSHDAYCVFNSSLGNWAASGKTSTNSWLQYKFETPVTVNTVSIQPDVSSSNARIKDFIIQGSNNGTNYVNLYTGTCANNNTAQIFTFDNSTSYIYYRLYINNSYISSVSNGILNLQFYGRQLKGLIPTMTSNITPSGVVTYSSIYSSEYEGWKAFDGKSSADGVGYAPSSTDKFGTAYVQYEFEKPKKAKFVGCSYRASTNTTFVYKLQASNDGNEFETLVESMEMKTPTQTSFSCYEINVDKAYKYYRFIYVSNSDNKITTGSGAKFQLY